MSFMEPSRRERAGASSFAATGHRLLVLAAAGCLAGVAGAARPAHQITFRDATRDAGITFVHEMGKSGEKMMVETMGAGGGFLDFENDGDLDLYLVNGAPLPGHDGTGPFSDALYRNDGGLRFTDVTAASGTGDTGYGMGVCAGDYDNDGFTDLYVTNYGPDTLYRNAGDGRFAVVTREAGVGDDLWSTSCAFLDHDGDGDLDLFAANYVDFSPANNKFCGDYPKGVRAYCHPNVYRGQPDSFWRNDGDGTFTAIGEAAGLSARDGNGLGVVSADFDDDGDVDLFVANDKTPNSLYRNDAGRFTDVTLEAGVGFGMDGVALAGMGTDFGDYDGDGDLDVVVTNLDFENNSLFRNEGGGLFSDASFASGIGAPSLSFVGFGAEFLDFDNDGRVDLAIANGHILDNASYFNDATAYAQRNFLFRGIGGGRMEEVGRETGPDMQLANVGRGLAVGDVDDDGDLDLLVTACGGRPRLLINHGGNVYAALRVRLVGRESNRSALGARVRLAGPNGPLVDEVRGGGSYLSQSEPTLHFGLGPRAPGAAAEGSGSGEPSRAGRLELQIRWPSGRRQTVAAPAAGGSLVIVEGEPAARVP